MERCAIGESKNSTPITWRTKGHYEKAPGPILLLEDQRFKMKVDPFKHHQYILDEAI